MTTIKITSKDGGEVNLTGYDVHERNVSLRKILREHVCEVTFTKMDGSVRVMSCTLKDGVVPAPVLKENAKMRIPNEANLSVWCINKHEWRSFKTANVTEVKVLA